ncbi:MAG: PAS domain S-box protein [Desulfobacteraceae bacterium]|jgi:chemotaxis protein methyltransferase CheR|nr:MAG: PAS domain S-box protein [Desulfobacteraceae bacterium]
MNKPRKTEQELLHELEELRSRLTEADDTLRAIRTGEVDALVVSTVEGDRIFTLSGADRPYRMMVETMNEGAVTLAVDGTILFCNQRFADIIKTPLEEVIGTLFRKYISPTDHHIFEAIIARCGKVNCTTELELQTGCGKSAPALLSVSPLRQADVPGSMCAVITDLSKQKRNEEMLAEERLTTQLLQQTSELFFICDSRGRIIRASQSAIGVLGRTPVFEEFDEVFHLLYPDGTPFILRSEIRKKFLHGVEVVFTNGGIESCFLLSANPLINRQEIIGIVVVIVDITDRKNMEEKIQKSHDELETLVEARTAELLIAKKAAEEGRQVAEASLLEIKKLKEQLEAERAYLQEEIKLEYNHENIIGQSDGLKYVLFKIEQIAATDTTVMILGETGVGKELAARAIHDLSLRKNRALVKVNCAALPSNLIESELFGHEKGAFTGAHIKRLGRFEIADGATLFLDEIGELPLELQSKLLRVLQDGEFERLGGTRTIKVDTRIIAATNRNLEAEVDKGGFRKDLWYRLNIFPITMPPLRDRLDDIPMLVDYYVKKISKRMGKTIELIPDNVMNTLRAYHWPGNVRELENVLERAVINSSGSKLRLADELKTPFKRLCIDHKTLEAVERDYIVQVLEETGWKVGGKNSAAEILGLKRSTLRARMRKLDIRKPT